MGGKVIDVDSGAAVGSARQINHNLRMKTPSNCETAKLRLIIPTSLSGSLWGNQRIFHCKSSGHNLDNRLNK